MSRAMAEWNVMVFLNADNNLERFGLSDFREMAQVGSTSSVNILVQFDRNGGYATTNPQWRQALRFRVERGMEPLPKNAIQDLGEANMGDGKVLADFVQWGRTSFPARRTMLVIWNHGQGWRVFETIPVSGNAEVLEAHRSFRTARRISEGERRALFLRSLARADDAGGGGLLPVSLGIPLDQVLSGTMRYVSTDETAHDQLYNREIQDSLLGCLQGRRLDLIGFDACLMGMVETGYAMRKVARMLVGSEELEPGDGWNYTDWLQKLVANPTMDALALGKTLVASYQSTYGAGSDCTLSAVDLDAMDPLANAVDALAGGLLQNLDRERGNIAKARSQCEEYAPGYGLHGIDLGRLCEQLRLTLSDGTLCASVDAVAAKLKAAVLANYAGTARQGAFGSSGLAIYFPESRQLFESDPDRQGYLKANTFYPVEFVQTKRWADFLNAYYYAPYHPIPKTADPSPWLSLLLNDALQAEQAVGPIATLLLGEGS